jgi:hypothetical protein
MAEPSLLSDAKKSSGEDPELELLTLWSVLAGLLSHHNIMDQG